MGYIRHHAIIISGRDDKKLKAFHKKAKEIFEKQVTNIVKSPVNTSLTFLIGPDGSKEGWDESDLGDKKRAEFIDLIDDSAYNDGSNSIRYCEVFYGDDERQSEIVNYN